MASTRNRSAQRVLFRKAANRIAASTWGRSTSTELHIEQTSCGWCSQSFALRTRTAFLALRRCLFLFCSPRRTSSAEQTRRDLTRAHAGGASGTMSDTKNEKIQYLIVSNGCDNVRVSRTKFARTARDEREGTSFEAPVQQGRSARGGRVWASKRGALGPFQACNSER